MVQNPVVFPSVPDSKSSSTAFQGSSKAVCRDYGLQMTMRHVWCGIILVGAADGQNFQHIKFTYDNLSAVEDSAYGRWIGGMESRYWCCTPWLQSEETFDQSKKAHAKAVFSQFL